jgi:hypothetical protein
MKLKFVGAGIHVRVLPKDDGNVGEHLREDVVIDTRIDPVAEIPDAAAKWLLEHEKGDWEQVHDSAKAKTES